MRGSLRCPSVGATLAIGTLHASMGWAALPLLDARDMGATRERLAENAAQLARASEGFAGLLTAEDRDRLAEAARLPDDEAVDEIQDVLDRYALAMVHIDDE